MMPHATRNSDKNGDTPKRYAVNLDWQKDSKIKTCKCNVCGYRVKNYSWQCQHCMKRICSGCTEWKGTSSPQHRAIADDHLQQGCWCGFIGKINPAMEGQIPPPPLPDTSQRPRQGSRKRKRRSAAKEESTASESLSEQDFQNTSQESLSQVARERPVRNKKKPNYADQERQAISTPSTKKIKISLQKQPPTDISVASPSTVIVGAGVIGMFIALELAEKAYTCKITHDITVIDINSAPCKLASGHCTGIISTAILDEQWQPLLGVSLPLWEELLGDQNFRKSSGFNEKNFVMAVDESEVGRPPVAWIREDTGFSCSPNEQAMGQIDPSKLAQWLYAHCTHFGVKFLFSTQPTALEQDKAGCITGLRVKSTMMANKRSGPIECSRLVLAAGPFTPSLLSTLFPHRQPALENNPRLYQWVQIKGAGLSKTSKAAAVMELPEDARFQGPAQVAARKDLIEISRLYSAIPEYTLDHEDAIRERVGSSTALRLIAAETLSLPGIHLADRRHTSQGVAIVSTGNGASPVVGKVPDWLVGGSGKASRASTGHEFRGVWLAYGFGAFGTTLAPGVARLLSQLISGEEPEIDLFDFEVTELEVLGGVGLMHEHKKASKGKARARR
ncbi:hypothetical protein AC579_1817 [Pseudocercospora musae]|uniref:FAD dependent oxidoreductase domain-containing protein n=1 Tax=Pseudocercospora musae TaxID=113226 RepID=A0A139IDN3_9PEZI|nr:hypothetical protein AC579_1817 [Pseudocercospora musae]